MAKLRNRHSLVDRGNLAHLLPSIKLMIIARKNSHIQDNHTTNRVSQSQQYSHHTVKYIFTIQYPYKNQACYDFQSVHYDSTHPDTYNLVADACACGGYLCSPPSCSPPSCSPPSYVLQVLQWINSPSPQGQPLMNFRPPATLTTGVSPLQVRLTDSSECQDATLP